MNEFGEVIVVTTSIPSSITTTVVQAPVYSYVNVNNSVVNNQTVNLNPTSITSSYIPIQLIPQVSKSVTPIINNTTISTGISSVANNGNILPNVTYANTELPYFIPYGDRVNFLTSNDIFPVLTVSTINCSEISTGILSLDNAVLTAQGNTLFLNGDAVVTASNISSLSDWSLDPAISTIDANYNDIIRVKRFFGSTITVDDVFSNQLNVNKAFISDLTVYQQTTENFASTISLEGRTIKCSTLFVRDNMFAKDGLMSSLQLLNVLSGDSNLSIASGSNLFISSSNDTTISAKGSLNLQTSNNYSIVGSNVNINAPQGGVNITSTSNDINITAPNGNILSNWAVNMKGGDITMLADEGARLDLFSDVNITAQNGNRGRVNITANGGFNNSINGEVNITANGKSSLLGVGAGGVVNITANTPPGFSNLTSAIKMSASGINMYAGFFPSIGSVAGYNFIYGLGGNVISAGNPPVFPSVPGTNYIWGEFGTTIANGFYTDTIYPNFTIAGSDLTIRGRTLPYYSGVRLSNVRSIYMDSPAIISNVGCNYGSNLSYDNGGFGNLLANFVYMGEVNGLPGYNSFIAGFCNITCRNLNISSINNAVYPPTGGGGGGGSAINNFSTASISSLTVSSINQYVNFVADSNSQGFIVNGDVPAILLRNTDPTSQKTGFLLASEDNNVLLQSFNTSNTNPLNMIFKADNFGFNITNITGGIEVDISGNTQIQNGSLTVSSIQGLQTINGTRQFIYGEFLATTSQSVGGVNVETTILLDTTTVANGMRESGGLVQVDYTGLYRYSISIQLDKSGGGTDTCDFWIQVNGNDVANSASEITVQGTNGECLANCQFYLSLNANDVVGIVFASSDNTMTATYFPSQTSPFRRPAIPAVIAQMELLK